MTQENQRTLKSTSVRGGALSYFRIYERRRGQRPVHHDQVHAWRRGYQPGHHDQAPATHNERRRNGLGATMKYLRRTTSAAASNGLSTAITPCNIAAL
jgi:hypothetical protein